MEAAGGESEPDVSEAEVTIACVGDVHGRLDRLDRVAAWLAGRATDAVLVTGDFGRARRGGPPPHEDALVRLEPLGVPVAFVPGNHDLRELEHPANVDRRVGELAGVRVFGLGGSPRTPARLPYEWTDEELDGLRAPRCDVVLSHAPPADTALDRMRGGRHVGSRVVRRIAEAHEGALVCGHIHEAASAETLGSCFCYNAGSLGAYAGRTQVGLLARTEPEGRWRVVHHDLEGGSSWRATAD